MDIGDLRPAELGQFIDHTLLKPDATEKDIGKLTEEAVRYGFAAVCVNPTWVSFCVDQLSGTEVAVATVVGFPLGATVTSAKVLETEIAVTEGAVEIDMVINIGRLSSGQLDVVKSDIAAVVTAADLGKAITKVIIETALLSDEQKIIASKLAVSAGADFVKTSTGFAGGGAQVKDVELIRLNIPSETGIKASGGIRTAAEVRSMLSAGATRIGASAGVTIVSEEAEG